MTDNFELSSEFQPFEGEANFGPTLTREVVGGTHIAPECVLVRGKKFVMINWPHGLARHDSGPTKRFPHGLMKFGETFEEAGQRLIKAQSGFDVQEIDVAYVYSYMDDKNHWHIEPLLIAVVSGDPKLPEAADGLVEFSGPELPEGAVWGQDAFIDAYKKYLLKYVT